jgi:hypothetical protein
MSSLIEFITGIGAWLLISVVICVPLMVSLYILVTPTYKLVEGWQNFRISRSRRSLKDRHFKGLPQRIKYCKLLSVVVFIAALWALYALYTSLTVKNNY